MTAPEQHRPVVYACAAGAVLHAHAAGSLEPAVLLYTFLPPGTGDWHETAPGQVDVHSDGPGSPTVTVRVLVEGQSLAWQLPLAPMVAALPGQPGDDGRMVLLGVVDGEPEPGFWASPVDCQRLAAELQLPVADLVDALRGRLTPWLADDLEALLHDDAHDHAADLSPAQTLASAVLAHYHGDLAAEQATTRVVRGLELTAREFQLELGSRLSDALASSIRVAGDSVDAVLAATGPFETEVLRLLTELPAALRAAAGGDAGEVATQLLLAGPDHDETLRAAVSVIGRLARAAVGPDLPDDQLLKQLGMVDDAALADLASLWVQLAATSAGSAADDATVAATLAQRIHEGGPPATSWLRHTAAQLAAVSRESPTRVRERLSDPLNSVELFLAEPPGRTAAPEVADRAVHGCLALARSARSRSGFGPGSWLGVPAPVAAHAVGAALLTGLADEVAVDLLVELVDGEVQAPDLLEAFVCVTAQLLSHADPEEPASTRALQVAEVLSAVAGGSRGARWLLVTCLREAPEHDPGAMDLTPLLSSEPVVDADRAAARVGRHGVLSAGLIVLDALVDTFGPAADLDRSDVLGVLLPAAMTEHELLRVSG